jgi:hypothetical protein
MCVCLTILFLSTGCDFPIMGSETSENEETLAISETSLPEDITESTSAAETDGSEATTVSTETAPETIPETTVTVPETTPVVTEPSISNPELMYTSYADIVSFDPATGWATFDYFDMLRGQEAIDWLVANEGYTVTAATNLVNDFADSEFINKNINPELRTADMQAVTINMMYLSDGTKMTGAETTPLTYSEFVTLYNGHPAYVMDSFFYRVIVSDGVITQVDQVYWP